MEYFIFNGTNSYETLGIVIKNNLPILLPKKDIDIIKVDGRNGNFYIDNGTYDSFSVTLQCVVTDLTKINNIKSTLQGIGTIEFSNNLGVEYKCVVKNQIPFNTYLTVLKEFPLQLELDPVGHSKTVTTETKTTSPATFTVEGTIGTLPTLEVKGTGEVTITLNGTAFTLSDCDTTAYIVDCDLMNVTKSDLQKNIDFTGSFPTLIIGTNNLSWTGTVTEIKIKYKKGWL